MVWLLRLFPEYRQLEQKCDELQTMVREGGDQFTRLQDLNHEISKQNVRLSDEIREARADQIYAHKSMANIRMQLDFGGMAPYREAYSLPPQVENSVGPVPSDRVHGRELVQRGKAEFLEALRSRQDN